MYEEDKINNFVSTILLWKQHNEMLYPDDVLNMLIQYEIVSQYQVKYMIDNQKNKGEFKLPKKYI